MTWIGVEAPQLELIASESLEWFDSSPGASRGFCRRCGSSVLFRSSRWAGELHVARACVPGVIDREPSAHVYADSAVSWLHCADTLPRRP